ncbi:TPA: insulinase family protein, partial [Streptococcus equi subsp. equi]|nr:insulinase family protein [Streptococcus equi subsp. equi]HEK9793440.1 insulinase family protein [Streptococcus equi subsp. equi]
NKKIIFKGDQDSKFAYFSLMFSAGTAIENTEELGFSHLIEHLLLRSGGEQSLNELFDNNGAFIGGETSRDYINLMGYCKAENFKNIFEAIVSRVFNLNLTEEELLREKRVVLVELTQYENGSKTEKLVSDNRLIFKNSKWSEDIIGVRENIESVDLKKLYKFYTENIQNGEFQIAISGPNHLKEEIAIIENKLPVGRTPVKSNFPIFSSGVTERKKNQQVSEISMYIDISKMTTSSHDVAILTILNAMLTGVKGSVLGGKLRTKNQWVYNIISFPIFYNGLTILKILTRTPEIHKHQVVQVLKEDLVNREDLKNTKLFDKAKKRVINEVLMSYEVKKVEFLKTLCREKLFNIPSWESVTGEIEKVSLNELNQFAKDALMQNKQFHIIINC